QQAVLLFPGSGRLFLRLVAGLIGKIEKIEIGSLGCRNFQRLACSDHSGLFRRCPRDLFFDLFSACSKDCDSMRPEFLPAIHQGRAVFVARSRRHSRNYERIAKILFNLIQGNRSLFRRWSAGHLAVIKEFGEPFALWTQFRESLEGWGNAWESSVAGNQ